MAGFIVWNILTSKWTYIVIAVLLGLLCGVLIWLGGYENPALYVAGGGALLPWSWRYEWMQKVGLGAGISSIILLLIVIGLSSLFGSSDDNNVAEEEESQAGYYDPSQYPPAYYYQQQTAAPYVFQT